VHGILNFFVLKCCKQTITEVFINLIIIGEKINGSIPSVAEAIANHDSDFIKHLAKIQTDSNASYIDCCASVEEIKEVETLHWLIDCIQEVSDLPVCVDSPSPQICVDALKFCKKEGIVNSVSMESNKTDIIFPAIADTGWGCIALLCGEKGIPNSAGKRMEIFEQIMIKAKEYGIAPSRLYIDPLVVALSTDQEALSTFTSCCREIKDAYPDIHITSGLSNISFGLPARKNINKAFMVLSMEAGMDSAIADPTNRDMVGIIYATEALLQNDEYCLDYIHAYRNGLIGKKPKKE